MRNCEIELNLKLVFRPQIFVLNVQGLNLDVACYACSLCIENMFDIILKIDIKSNDRFGLKVPQNYIYVYHHVMIGGLEGVSKCDFFHVKRRGVPRLDNINDL